VFFKFPIRAKLKWLWSVPEIARELHHAYEETLKLLQNPDYIYLNDIYGGTTWMNTAWPILSKFPHSIFIAMTNDPVGLDKHLQSSFTPYLLKILNLPLVSRRKFMILFGLFHRYKESKADKKDREAFRKEISKYGQGDLEIIFEELLDLFNNPEEIEDWSTNPPTKAFCRLILLFTSSDLRCIAKLNQQKSTPARVGACGICTVTGQSIPAMGSTYYLGAAYFLPSKHKTRTLFEQFRKKTSFHFSDVITDKPKIKTHDDVVKMQEEAEKSSDHKQHEYLGKCALQRLPYADIIKIVRSDFMHITGDVSKNLLFLMLKRKPFNFNKKRREFEQLELKRFTSQPYEFQMSSEDIKVFESLHKNTRFPKLHGERGKPANIFTEGKWLKTSDCVFYASEYGIYCVENSAIPEPTKSVICRLLALLRLIRFNAFNLKIIKEANLFAIETIALCEIYLPVYFFGINLHLLVHMFAPEGSILQLGPAISHHNYDAERMAGSLSSMAKSRKAPLSSVKKNYLIYNEIKFKQLALTINSENDYKTYDRVARMGEAAGIGLVQDDIRHMLPPYPSKDQPPVLPVYDFSGTFYNSFTLNGTLFALHTTSRVYNNSTCKVVLEGEDVDYAIIDKIFIPDVAKDILLVKVRWYDKVKKKSKKRRFDQDTNERNLRTKCEKFLPNLQKVKARKDQWSDCIWVDSIVPVSVSFLPSDPTTASDVFTVVEFPEYI
jgi:hypothetical protein